MPVDVNAVLGWQPRRDERARLVRPGQIRSAAKGAALERLAARGFKAPTKAILPAWDLVMPSGRLLRFDGVHPSSSGGATVQLSCWEETMPDGATPLPALRVRASVDPDRKYGRFLHLSVSYPDRYPGWDELLEVRYTFYPRDVDVMMIMPRDGAYVNLHEYCFHLRQTPEVWSE